MAQAQIERELLNGNESPADTTSNPTSSNFECVNVLSPPQQEETKGKRRSKSHITPNDSASNPKKRKSAIDLTTPGTISQVNWDKAFTIYRAIRKGIRAKHGEDALAIDLQISNELCRHLIEVGCRRMTG